MIVVFVVDTSPSMAKPLSDGTARGMSKLDIAKMTVESLTKAMRKRVSEHNGQFQQETAAMQQSLYNLGLGHCKSDQFLLLSTGRQDSHHPGAAACGAGGRLLIGYGDSIDFAADHHPGDTPPIHGHHGGFDRALKHLQATDYQQSELKPFPEDAGGAAGLNAAMNCAIGLLSRYRLNNRATENFGLGRLPSCAMPAPSGGGAAVNALMPACLVLLTDGECLRKPASEGGGSLQLQFGSAPLREFYHEPFRWDQRIFCLGVGGPDGVSSSQYIPDDLRRLCEVTGGCHTMLRSPTGLSQNVDAILKLIAPPRPKVMPISYPLRTSSLTENPNTHLRAPPGLFVNGGPICCFQSLEAGPHGETSPTRRAMLLFVPSEEPLASPGPEVTQIQPYAPPIWCIPESFFPSKKFESLPPRLAEPLLRFSGNYSLVGSNMFDPAQVMKLLQRLDQLTLANRKLSSTSGQQQNPVKFLHRDTYICEWLSEDGKSHSPPRGPRGMEYFPVCVQGAGRPLAEGDEHFLNIGILHIPPAVASLSNQPTGAKFSTLTLLPPDPQILLPLLVKAAEAEHRLLKKQSEPKEASAGRSGATAGLIQAGASNSGQKHVHLDEHWKSEFRAYMFRIPPYYHNALKRSLRPILPASAHSLLNLDGNESLASQCFSKACLQKIRNGEQVARDNNERLERQEAELRRRGSAQTPELFNKSTPSARHPNAEPAKPMYPVIGYGQYDPRDSTASYLAALRTMPAPWRVKSAPRTKEKEISVVESSSQDGVSDTASVISSKDTGVKTVVDVYVVIYKAIHEVYLPLFTAHSILRPASFMPSRLGDLPNDCLLPYYESRRRWIFGGSGLTTRGLHVEGVNNDGSNAQYYGAHHSVEDESLLSFAGVGASTLNKTTTAKMGDFRERLLWSRAPVVGYGSNGAAGVSSTTGPDGAPIWSVDDDAMPMSFFDLRTGEFTDSVQTRVSSRVMGVNFGNPFKDKRGDAIVPENFFNQSPSFQRGRDDASDEGPHTPPGSPPHDAFTSSEGEDEAVFVVEKVRRKSPHHVSAALSMEHEEEPISGDKRPREESESKASVGNTEALEDNAAAVPRKKAKVAPEPPPPPSKPPHSQSAAPRPPPPPPKPSHKKHPPPPPPRPPPRPPAEKHPATKPPAPAPAPAPRPKPAETTPALSESTTTTTDQGLDLQSPDKKPQVDLPSGWMCVWSKSQKRWYFFDTKTNKSVWQWPPPGELHR